MLTRSQEDKRMEDKKDVIEKMEAQVEEFIERMKNFLEVLQELEVWFQEVDNTLLQGAAGLLLLLFLLAAYMRQ